ncbi:hypothetical protein AMAG_07480 [Allomyces macrogynus ATCC 38327]|uniref:Uncharacterized protein n=1 Tax=Allomyces macrogynus (strain ATCC 38327) TaxID=578462 RepID=A0A0L0SI96_ALLM3|nr:hypothetical protein AMAG_07480 [Allomyces macrogynus ATCC 38327]|eukprot:KNE62241.1 hypothetical protein AMAG_07480 [Allomyces macrogynus ATCC 38327]
MELSLAVEATPSMEDAPLVYATAVVIVPYQIRLAEGVTFAYLLRRVAAAHAGTNVPVLGNKRPHDALMSESQDLDQVLHAAVTGAPLPKEFSVLEHVHAKRQCQWKQLSDNDVVWGRNAEDSLRFVERPGFAYRENPRAWHPFSGAVSGRWVVKYKPVDLTAAVAAAHAAGQ